MIYSYNGSSIYYRLIKGEGKGTIVFLHGWGRSGDDFNFLPPCFEGYDCLLVDFPPFGKSEFSPAKWSIFSYANMIVSLCEHLKISSAIFVAHSFGGRILILLACLHSSLVQKCIFANSAGLKPRRGIKYHTKIWRYKITKKLGRNCNGGSRDYQALSPEMKGLFKNIVNTNLDEFARKIRQKTLIFWGENDRETPLYMAKRLGRYIKNSRLVKVKGGHFAFIEEKLQFVSAVKEFLKEKK